MNFRLSADLRQLDRRILNEKTGLNFQPLQNGSNHGCDGCAVAINGDTITVVVMDAKSSMNGVNKAGKPHGDPETRLRGWLGIAQSPIRTQRYVILCEQRCFLKTSKSKA
ncbi:hypothetical protein [Pseudomonas viridiflava]|uniref:hypothetical protein n=1 Tax=Pseudomonas viridiflava TaxID=33069 RepID=UPI00211F414A|nr:hypothetical protein [Pseudomonas viridiflava]MEE4918414.1 hypothetical protein [Pseudomonas alliivorans]MEE4954519.1 hypothetical protein [Pseudomonas alliivorans]MEE4965000.1 hypothetical protein [Pseudomonas alliivorans]MEE4985550.1 hypothetical protein [Pseudomonas alliivorans]MEE4990636.1 hypothetical protein [Pseudomonas alliivorans]